MTDFPSLQPLPLFVHTYTRWGCLEMGNAIGGITPASQTWPVANTAFYVPVSIPWPYPVRRVFWINGTSTTTTNMDLGIYTAAGERLYSTGSTAQGTASTTQYVTPTEFMLYPGQYFFALACSSTTANRGGWGVTGHTVARQRLVGILQEASALALPATMTPSASANPCFPFFGVTRTTSGF